MITKEKFFAYVFFSCKLYTLGKYCITNNYLQDYENGHNTSFEDLLCLIFFFKFFIQKCHEHLSAIGKNIRKTKHKKRLFLLLPFNIQLIFNLKKY